jgi:hypothetical protein
MSIPVPLKRLLQLELASWLIYVIAKEHDFAKEPITEDCLPPVHRNMGSDPKQVNIGIFLQRWC